MKKQLAVLAALIVVLVCLGIAVIYSNDHRAKLAAAQTSQVQGLKKQLLTLQQEQTLHDQVDVANLKNASDQIINLTQQKTALCIQVKAARLTQPLCP